MDLVGSVHVVSITTGLSYSERSHFKKWHFLDLACSVDVFSTTTRYCYINGSRLKKWNYLDLLVCLLLKVAAKNRIFLTQNVQ